MGHLVSNHGQKPKTKHENWSSTQEQINYLWESQFFCVLIPTELKIQAMMLTPNGLLNPKASMPPSPAAPLPVITHTAATPIINSCQSRRASAASMDICSIEQRSPVSLQPWCNETISHKVDLLNYSRGGSNLCRAPSCTATLTAWYVMLLCLFSQGNLWRIC